ncbi:hypothetical protein KUTeg_013138 [Tegillarca granosa]|uniref:Dynein heavy chain n=1 Tax=Tegillarca granosa TaxID=220873 RepID=A0ABQ9ET76_TEGGR|nr:hypothetical protein KUTeg_013138 [Tegillarca granosa]
MLRTFGSGGTGVVTEKMYNETDKGPAWAKLLFGLCLFNSVLHERKKYGRLGWNISYGFNDSDLEVSMQQLEILLKEHTDIPWKALTYLIGEIYKPVQDGYSFPDVCTYLESLPNYDSPEVFGMNENAEKACRQNQAYNLIDTIISVQPRLSLELSEKTNDEIVTEIATDIMHQLPEVVDVIPDKDAMQKAINMVVGNSALMTVLRQEIDRFNNLLTIIHKSLNLLVLAVKGEIIMSDMLEEAYSALLSQKIAAYESCKPLGSWVQDLVRRVDFFTLWAEMIDENVVKVIKSISQSQQSKSPSTPDMTDSFLTGILQNHARKLGISVDSLVFNFEVKTSKHDTEETLNDLKHRTSIKDAAFTISSTITTSSDKQQTPDTDTKSTKSVYECPLYRTSARAGTLSSTGHSTNFVTAVSLPSDHSPDFWVMRGVALLCQLDD